MPHSIGVTITERITAGLVSGHTVVGDLRIWPLDPDDADGIVALPGEQIAELIRDEILALAKKTDKVIAIGIGIPGIVRHGTVEDSPNVPQLKGLHIREMVHALLKEAGLEAPIEVNNDADAIAAGLASTTGKLDRSSRVWTLGTGIGYGRFPLPEGVWEGGHTVVTLDSKETYCGCGGRGHLEGIMGHRAMRLRFLDMEPEEVFAAAKPQGTKQGDPRCVEFVKTVAPGAGRGHSQLNPPRRAGQILTTPASTSTSST